MRSFSIFCLVAILGAAILTTGCQVGTPGSGVAKTELRQVDDFTSIHFSGSGVVDVTVGPTKSVEVTLDDNLLEMVETEVRDGALRIDTKGSWSTRIGLQVKITVPELNSYHGAGSGDATIKNVGSENFTATISGSGTIVADGVCKDVKATISGSGDIDMTKLNSIKASVVITGSGNAAINASETAMATITGSGNIDVHGNPEKLAESITGSGDINRK